MTDRSSVSFQAVLFDLDDTLLYNNMEGAFLKAYFALLTEYARPLCASQELMGALTRATKAIVCNQDPYGPTNEQAFAAVFAPSLGRPWGELKAFFARFYEDCFPELQVHARAHPEARQTVQACLDAGYQVVIATNPLFPARAIEHRMAWAGVDDLPFALVTTYENMHTCKPAPAYYIEIAHRIDVACSDCLMVGNDAVRDIAPAREAGMHTFLADEWVTNTEPGITADRKGTLSELVLWLADLQRSGST
jgi:FMN phosphatase YigB (HAD superfamily)